MTPAVVRAVERHRSIARTLIIVVIIIVAINVLWAVLVMRDAWLQWLVAPLGPAITFRAGILAARLNAADVEIERALDAERALMERQHAAEEERIRRAQLAVALALGPGQRGGQA